LENLLLDYQNSGKTVKKSIQEVQSSKRNRLWFL